MAEPAIKRMTLAEFLRWEDGTNTRYELVRGVVVAMAPPTPRHGALFVQLAGAIDAVLEAKPGCTAYGEAGIVRPDRNDTFYVADIAVSCDPPDPDDQYLRNPILIVEILSPSTVDFDRNTKISEYQSIPSVQEILLLDSGRMFAEVLRREGDRWVTEIAQGPTASLTLRSVPLSIPMAALYRRVRLPGWAGRHGGK